MESAVRPIPRSSAVEGSGVIVMVAVDVEGASKKSKVVGSNPKVTCPADVAVKVAMEIGETQNSQPSYESFEQGGALVEHPSISFLNPIPPL